MSNMIQNMWQGFFHCLIFTDMLCRFSVPIHLPIMCFAISAHPYVYIDVVSWLLMHILKLAVHAYHFFFFNKLLK